LIKHHTNCREVDARILMKMLEIIKVVIEEVITEVPVWIAS
jgi:hypothetical protein